VGIGWREFERIATTDRKRDVSGFIIIHAI